MRVKKDYNCTFNFYNFFLDEIIIDLQMKAEVCLVSASIAI